jgi:hypothetical protein
MVLLALLIPVAVVSANSTAARIQEAPVYVCPMHPEVHSSKPGACPKCGMTLELKKSAEDNAQKKEPESVAPSQGRSVEAVKGAQEYFCSMHPNYRANAPGKCPKCGMTLIPVEPPVPEDFDLKIEPTPKSPKPGEKLVLRFSIFNPRTGEQVKEFNVMHEKIFHLFIVSQDMSVFQHIHPVFQPDGSFVVETVLPKAGRYKIYSDIYPATGAAQVLQRNIATAGCTDDLFGSEPQLTPDSPLTTTVAGTRVDLVLDPAKVISGQPVALKYHLTDAKTGQPVRDLVPYLGAWGHTLILSSDQRDYVHSHPEESVEDVADKSKLHGGPDVTFNAFMPRPGVYRIWTQFQRGDKLATYSFTIRVDELR